MEDERRRQFKELVQTKIAADDADPRWILAWVGLEVLDVLGEIAEHNRMIKKALTGPLHRGDYNDLIEPDMAINDQLRNIAIAIGKCVGRKM
jgi:hypothetical protein